MTLMRKKERARLSNVASRKSKLPTKRGDALDSLEKIAGDLREEDVASRRVGRLAGAAGCGHRAGRGRPGGRETGQRDRDRGCPVRECRTR